MNKDRTAFVSALPVVGTARFSRSALLSSQRKQRCKPRVSAIRMNAKTYDVDITLYGKDYTIPVAEDQTLLEGIEEFGLEVPYSCRAGVCITCAAKVLSGDVDPGEAAITDDLKADGYVLTCSGFPRSQGIKLELNHFDDAYDKQYGQYEMK